MSEEQKPAEVAIGFVGQTISLKLTFSDGERIIPDYVVDTIGREALEARAEKLKGVTYDEFMIGFGHLVQRQDLRQFQETFLARHFKTSR